MTIRRDFVAVVDDDPQMLRSLTRLLSATGYRPVTFSSAQEFLASVATSKAICLLLDIDLGAQSGLELACHSAVMALAVPIIFMSGSTDDGPRRQALASGAAAFLRKPFRAVELLDALARAIQSSMASKRTTRGARALSAAGRSLADAAAVRVVKKRANRRLLDVARNRYVNLADLRTMVMQRVPLVIVDKNGLDITRDTLLQALIEQELGEHAVLSGEFLKQLIRCNAGPRAASLRAYLDDCVSRWSKSEDQPISTEAALPG